MEDINDHEMFGHISLWLMWGLHCINPPYISATGGATATDIVSGTATDTVTGTCRTLRQSLASAARLMDEILTPHLIESLMKSG